MALYKGLTVILANEDEQRNPKLMVALIQDSDVNMLQMTLPTWLAPNIA